ncbi:unnamed protein product, partial [Coregonus sp. 'balchen']
FAVLQPIFLESWWKERRLCSSCRPWVQRAATALVGTLGQLLTRDDPYIVMNAAGALASLAKCSAGRGWLLRDQAVFGQVLTSLLTLLDQGRENTVNSAALILARLSLCEVACQGLLCHPSEKCFPESGLEVTYSLLDRETVLYRGTLSHVTLPVFILKPGHELSLRLLHSISDGGTSTCSDPVLLAIESEGEGQGPVIHRSCWVVCPQEPCTSWVCVQWGLGKRLARVQRWRSVQPRTKDHAPSGLTMVVLGRHELQIMWGAPLVPLGCLFHYELRLNGHVAYLGTERAHIVRRLATNTAYTCTVTAITSKGRCQSRPITKRTACDEYPHTEVSILLQPPATSSDSFITPISHGGNRGQT